MKKRTLSLLLAAMLCIGLATPAFAVTEAEVTQAEDATKPEATENVATEAEIAAAGRLYELGLFQGKGDTAEGKPNYALTDDMNRMEAVTMLVRLMGQEKVALEGTWTTPFTDVEDWAKPYVGYAYENGLTQGVDDKAGLFGSKETVTAAQYLTFVLRALGYDSATDFKWDSPWTLSDTLKITNGEYNAESTFDRGNAVLISATALDVKVKAGDKTLLELIKENLAANPVEPEPKGDEATPAK